MNNMSMSEKNKTIGKSLPSDGTVNPLTMTGSKSGNSERIKELKKPRSRKYIQDTIELQEMLMQLDKLRTETQIEDKENNNGIELDKLNRGSNVSSINDDSSIQSIEKGEISNESLNTGEKIEEVTGGSSPQEIEVSIEENTNIKTEKDYEIEALEKRIQAKIDSMAKECPIICELLTLIYPSTLESYLLSCGVIKARGWAVHSRNDMANSADEKDQGLIEHLKRGYDIYMQHWNTPGFLCLEIYRDAYCLIYRDGIVRTII